MKELPAALEITPDLLTALKRIDAGSKTAIYGSMLCEEAERIRDSSTIPQMSDPFGPILASINSLIRSLKRSTLSPEKIRKKITALPDPAGNFLRLNLMRNLDRIIEPDNEDWANPEMRQQLLIALETTRIWFRNTPGPVRAEALQQFALNAAYIYEQITGQSPGLGKDDYEEGYQTPFEELWLASLRIAEPKATHEQAREIYRTASGRR